MGLGNLKTKNWNDNNVYISFENLLTKEWFEHRQSNLLMMKSDVLSEYITSYVSRIVLKYCKTLKISPWASFSKGLFGGHVNRVKTISDFKLIKSYLCSLYN